MDFIAEINARIGAIDEQLAVAQKANEKYQDLLKQLEQARRELQAASGWHEATRRRDEKTRLLAVKAQIEQGAKAIAVRQHSSDILIGAILKRTPARVTVLTSRGEMIFSLKPTEWLKAGYGYGKESAGHSINPADLD